MADKSSRNAIPQTSPQLTLEERFAALEANFIDFKKVHIDLHERIFKLTEDANGKITEVAVTERSITNEIKDQKGKPAAEEEAISKSRAKIVINRADPETGERTDKPPDESTPTPQITDASHAFILRKNVYEDADQNDGEIEIISSDLCKFLKNFLSHYPYHMFLSTPATIRSPYEVLIQNWETLVQASEEAKEDDDEGLKQARSDLKLLLDTISATSGDPKLDKYLKTRNPESRLKSVTFDTLWTIFPPGILIYGKPFQGQDQVFIVQDNERPWPYNRRALPYERRPWGLICWTYDWDGRRFMRVPVRIEFDHFEGEMPITSLPYYPFELVEQNVVIRANLIKQGKAFRKACIAKQGDRMYEYIGEAIFLKKGFSGVQADDDEDDDVMSHSVPDPEMDALRRRLRSSKSESNISPLKSTKVDSRVMVDFDSYFRYGPAIVRVGSLSQVSDSVETTCTECRENQALRRVYRTRFDEDDHQENWDEEQYLLCPPRVLGYILRDKQWAQLQVSTLESITTGGPNDSWTNRLKLPDGNKTKDMILNLVKGHGTGDSKEDNPLQIDDIIVNKGKGLVILLYGPPGVGKTSTAETVALAARKPLFSISVADVGTKAKRVEANLAKIFALATSWQAILLIDEADVFLESRGKGIANNTERNALVSVFLRVLEYYQGILMLTTNQIAQFDVAVQSRIHVAFKFLSLNEQQTLDIFLGFLDPLVKEGLIDGMEDIKSWLEEDIVKMGLDGRQIRNIITSALGLARAQKSTKLTKLHLKTLLNNVKDFKYEFIKQFEQYKTEQQGMVGK